LKDRTQGLPIAPEVINQPTAGARADEIDIGDLQTRRTLGRQAELVLKPDYSFGPASIGQYGLNE
jgi:hypothetical protein